MGATGGLGKAFAFSLAKEGYSLLLTGRSMEKLSALKAELQAVYPTLECHYYAVNLAEEGERTALMDWIVSEKYNLSLLANVAGVDIHNALPKSTLQVLPKLYHGEFSINHGNDYAQKIREIISI